MNWMVKRTENENLNEVAFAYRKKQIRWKIMEKEKEPTKL